jgi:hypothetical protein
VGSNTPKRNNKRSRQPTIISATAQAAEARAMTAREKRMAERSCSPVADSPSPPPVHEPLTARTNSSPAATTPPQPPAPPLQPQLQAPSGPVTSSLHPSRSCPVTTVDVKELQPYLLARNKQILPIIMAPFSYVTDEPLQRHFVTDKKEVNSVAVRCRGPTKQPAKYRSRLPDHPPFLLLLKTPIPSLTPGHVSTPQAPRLMLSHPVTPAEDQKRSQVAE